MKSKIEYEDMIAFLISTNDESNARIVKLSEDLERIEDRLKANTTANYELHEYTIPRLFIVLPIDGSRWNPIDLFSNRLRLYFLCECGEHTKSINNEIPHHIHLARHEGYDIDRPKEFVQQYGSYVRTIFKMLKTGIAVAGIAVPALSQLISTDATGHAMQSLKALEKTLESGINQVISYIDKVSKDEGESMQGLEDQMTNSEALEGADLRQLKSFLKNKDTDMMLGNLSRTVTDKGHVKWVCIDHYRPDYRNKTEEFRDAVASLGGSFESGRVEVRLSKVQAMRFYQMLVGAKFVRELSIELDWTTARSDFRDLQHALDKTSVAVLNIILNNLDGPIWRRIRRHDPIFDIMKHPSILSVAITRPSKDFINQSSLRYSKINFLYLKHLDIDVDQLKHDIRGLKSLVVKAPNLTTLTFRKDGGDFLHIYIAIAKHQTYPVFFPAQPLRILPPKGEPHQSMTGLKVMADLLKVFGERIEIVKFSKDGLDDSTMAGFARAIENGSSLKELTLEGAGKKLSQHCIKDLASIVASSELRKLVVHLGIEKDRIDIFESIQWKHIRHLVVRATAGVLETQAMMALVESARKEPGTIELEEFSLVSESDSCVPLLMPQDEHLSAFIALTSLKRLTLDVVMTEEQVPSLQPLGFAGLQELRLCYKGFDSTEAEALLEGIQNATRLRHAGLSEALRTNSEGEEKMYHSFSRVVI
jgi:hypothetical protein